MKKNVLYSLCECAVLVALAAVLTFFKIEIGAFGGSIDFVMIPLFIIAYRHGAGYGIASGLVFGLIKCIIGGGIGWGLPSVLLDYVLAYGAVGVAGLFKGKSKFIEIAAFTGCFARYIIHFISGIALQYAITEPTEVMGITVANPVIYSMLYNIAYMLPNTIIAIVVMSLLRYPLKRIGSRGQNSAGRAD